MGGRIPRPLGFGLAVPMLDNTDTGYKARFVELQLNQNETSTTEAEGFSPFLPLSAFDLWARSESALGVGVLSIDRHRGTGSVRRWSGMSVSKQI